MKLLESFPHLMKRSLFNNLIFVILYLNLRQDLMDEIKINVVKLKFFEGLFKTSLKIVFIIPP